MFLVFIWTFSIKSTFTHIMQIKLVFRLIPQTNFNNMKNTTIQVQFQSSRNQERPDTFTHLMMTSALIYKQFLCYDDTKTNCLLSRLHLQNQAHRLKITSDKKLWCIFQKLCKISTVGTINQLAFTSLYNQIR